MALTERTTDVCASCGEHGRTLLRCVKCSNAVCVDRGLLGCIDSSSLSTADTKTFQCPRCYSRSNSVLPVSLFLSICRSPNAAFSILSAVPPSCDTTTRTLCHLSFRLRSPFQLPSTPILGTCGSSTYFKYTTTSSAMLDLVVFPQSFPFLLFSLSSYRYRQIYRNMPPMRRPFAKP